jgi:hypothetical protein
MKSFTQFLSEASAASAQALKLNLKSDGHGGWYDSRGEFVAKTEGGKLKFYGKNQKVGQKDEPRRPGAAVAAMPKKRVAAPQAPAPKKAKAGEQPEKGAPEGSNTITIAFGRFNPPTRGHGKVLEVARKTAAGGDLKIYPSRTQDSNRNPLDPDMKVSYLRKMFPDYAEEIVNDPEMKTIFDVLGVASKEGYEFVNVVAGPDRINEFTKILQDYNGSEYFNFADGYNTVVSGPRDEDASGPEGDSATKQRKSIKDNDYEGFKSRLPKEFDEAEAMALFNATRQGMGIKASKAATKATKAAIAADANEECELWKIAPRLDPKGLREHYVREEIYNLGDTVQNLNTGVVGRIIRRGTNHLICVTEEEMMFKAWIRDVMEYNEVKPAHKTGKYGVSSDNRLVGTNAFRRYAQSMVPGQEKISNFKEFLNKYRKK